MEWLHRLYQFCTRVLLPARWHSQRPLFWGLHLVLVGLIVVGLWHLNGWLALEKHLRSDWPILHSYWLPLLFLILYALWWLGLWLWDLTSPDAVGLEHPEVNAAWQQALDALRQAGIDLRSTPLYLILGTAETAGSTLLEAAGLVLQVRQTPNDPDAPLHVQATADAIFVTCPELSLLARQARALASQQRELGPAPQHLAPTIERVATEADPDAHALVLGAEDEEPWSEEERRVVGLLTAVAPTETVRPQTGTALMRNSTAIQQTTERLQHLCRLIQRDRRPCCPVNGVLVLVPYLAAQEEMAAGQTATACRYDLLVIQETLQVRCPVEVVVTGLEQSPGFREMLRRLPAGQPLRRLGQPFPLVPDIDEEEVAGMVQQGLGWFTGQFVPALVCNLFRLEGPVPGHNFTLSEAEAQAANERLYHFLAELRERQQRLGRLLVRGLLLEMPSYYISGIHFAGRTRTGYALLPGVFDRVSQNQNYVAWTRAALVADRWHNTWAGVLLLVAGLLLVGAPVAVWLWGRIPILP